jgi:hypothetical protein
VVDNLAFLADGESLPGGTAPELVEDAVGLADGFVLVGNQGKRQVETFGETGLGVEVVGADADDLDSGTLEPRVELLESLELGGSAAGEGFGEEGEDGGAALEKVGEDQGVGSGGGSGEFGGGVAGGGAGHLGGDPCRVNEGYVNDGSGAPGGIRAAGGFDRAD